jgi:hypothetical protein
MPKTKTLDLSECEKAYIAGIMDGEGSITFYRSKAARTRGRYLTPFVRISTTDDLLVPWLFHKIGFGAKRYRANPNGPIHWKPVWHIQWSTSQAVELLKAIEPYLIIKRERAQLVIEIWELNRTARESGGGYFGNGHPVPEWLLSQRRSAFDRMKVLNRKGSGLFQRQNAADK